MQEAFPWLYWSWYYAHRLELACKNAFCSSLFNNIVEMLLCLFYIYEKSPKKSYELTNIVDRVFEFPKGGHLPIWSHGTRCVTHKRKALQRVLDRYGAYMYIHHLSTLTEDSSLKSDDRQHLKGYLLKWRQPKMLIGCAMYVEALKPFSLCSLTLQKEGADIVTSIENIQVAHVHVNKPHVSNGNIKWVHTIGTRKHAVQRSLAFFEARRVINMWSPLEENKETDWRRRVGTTL